MSDFDKIFEDYLAYQAAIESAWRWFRRNEAPVITLSEIMDRVRAKYPNADKTRVQEEFNRRVSRSRSCVPKKRRGGCA
jgi:hypothetical protein